MKHNIKSIAIALLALVTIFTGCKKEEFAFGELKAPSDLTLTTVVTGVDATNPNGNGSGTVTVTATSKNALSYNIDF